MIALFAFTEQKEAESAQAKALVLSLLEEEERQAQADFEQFEQAMSAFEERFWQTQFAQSEPPSAMRDYLCGVHALDELEARHLARQGLYDLDILAAALGTSPDCPTCKRGLQRVVLEELHKAKLDKAFLTFKPEAGRLLPLRATLFERGGALFVSMLEVSVYRDLLTGLPAESARPLDWMEVSQDILFRALTG